jgi:hypothetical protein
MFNKPDDFLTKDNINVLWDVIVSEESVPKESLKQISELFNSNIQGFYNAEKSRGTSLFEMNKKYIMLILNYVKNTRSKIVINDNERKPAITFEEIHEDRRSQFDKDYSKIQDNFNSVMTPPTPPKPNFGDIKDEPINEMESAVQKMTEQRKYDIEQINKNYKPPTAWLPNHIKIHNEEPKEKPKVIDLVKRNERHISWSDDTEMNIFSKLKHVKEFEPVLETRLDHVLDSEKSTIYDIRGQMKLMDDKLEMLNKKIDGFFDMLKTTQKTTQEIQTD